jgi:AbrB family looped-hinge helix DNA binding protein
MRVRVNQHNQITLPAEMREKLRIAPGDQLLIEVRDGSFVLMPEPKDYVERLHGLHKEIWEGIDVKEYIHGERAACPE